MNIQRYLLFAGDDFYPSGGIHDYIGCFESLEVAVAYAKVHYAEPYGWYHIVDKETLEIVAD